ncbi:MAG: PhnE/PtxC family ABC transporter permease [Coriobacteriales bacterium]
MSSLQAPGAPAARVQGDAFFTRRAAILAACAAGFVLLNGVTAAYVHYDFLSTLVEIPRGFAWMLAEFMPTPESLEKLPAILEALLETVLVSVAASAVAALLAYILAVLGSRSVGLGGPFPLLARGIASLFRNIPVVAWALILLFSFKQSEFTGFLALLLTSFGYLTRCFLESIDELASGPVEALRACGAGYLQIIACAVIPLSLTSVVSWLLYMIETNIRDATLVGILTGTGIGFVFDIFYKSFRYDVAGLVIVLIAVVVIACELTSNYVRRKVL